MLSKEKYKKEKIISMEEPVIVKATLISPKN